MVYLFAALSPIDTGIEAGDLIAALIIKLVPFVVAAITLGLALYAAHVGVGWIGLKNARKRFVAVGHGGDFAMDRAIGILEQQKADGIIDDYTEEDAFALEAEIESERADMWDNHR